MNFNKDKISVIKRICPYLWLASFGFQLFLLLDFLGLISAVAVFVIVTGLQIHYRFIDGFTGKNSVISAFAALILGTMITFFWQISAYWNTDIGFDILNGNILFLFFKILSVAVLIYPFINNLFDYKRFSLSRLGSSVIVVIPFYFILFCYLPCETYINNLSGFNFPFQSFVFYELYYFVSYTLITSLIVSVLAKNVYTIAKSVILGIDICCYIQYMFLNSKLHLLDGESMKWEEYTGFAAVTLLIWLAVIAALVLFSIKRRELYDKISVRISAVLLAVQGLSAGIMIVMAGDKLYNTELEHMSGEEQFTVSGARNVIMFILDATDNDYFKEVLEENPEAFEGYEDFTLYTNTCSVFDSTPTSITQMITGMDFAVELNCEDWYRKAWKSEKATEFFDRFHSNNYIINGYYTTYDEQILGKGMIDNYKKLDSSEYKSQVQIDGRGLTDEFTVLSMYRILPFVLKRFTDYESINFNVHVMIENGASYYNDDFAEKMQLKKSENNKNYLIIEHLDGTHPPCDDFTGESRRLLAMIRDYMDQLREFGVYDESSIIITADHGRHNDTGKVKAGTPVLMIKRSNSSKSELTLSSAPVYHEDIQATLLDCAGLYDSTSDTALFGRSVFDIKEDEVRERTWYDRRIDPEFKPVKCPETSAFVMTNHNAYYGYTYTGDTSELERMVTENRPTNKYHMTDYKG